MFVCDGHLCRFRKALADNELRSKGLLEAKRARDKLVHIVRLRPRIKVCSALNGCTWRQSRKPAFGCVALPSPSLSKSCVFLHLCCLSTINPANEDEGAHLRTVPPQRHSWCCTLRWKDVLTGSSLLMSIQQSHVCTTHAAFFNPH